MHHARFTHGKLRPRGAEELAWGHTARKRQSWCLRLGLCSPQAVPALTAASCSLGGFQSSWGGRTGESGKEASPGGPGLVSGREWLTHREDRGCWRRGTGEVTVLETGRSGSPEMRRHR